MSTKPTYEQAQLHLQVYDQRREAKLRQARDWFFKNYHVTSLDDAMRVASMRSETGTFASMVISYWEQAVLCSTMICYMRTCSSKLAVSFWVFGIWPNRLSSHSESVSSPRRSAPTWEKLHNATRNTSHRFRKSRCRRAWRLRSLC